MHTFYESSSQNSFSFDSWPIIYLVQMKLSAFVICWCCANNCQQLFYQWPRALMFICAGPSTASSSGSSHEGNMSICMPMTYFIFRYINYITLNYQWCSINFWLNCRDATAHHPDTYIYSQWIRRRSIERGSVCVCVACMVRYILQIGKTAQSKGFALDKYKTFDRSIDKWICWCCLAYVRYTFAL